MERLIITVIGKDTVGIIAKVCILLSENNVNINDISQSIVDGYFTMMMIADMSACMIPLADLQEKLDQLGQEIGVQIRCQREEIFNKMHRI